MNFAQRFVALLLVPVLFGAAASQEFSKSVEADQDSSKQISECDKAWKTSDQPIFRQQTPAHKGSDQKNIPNLREKFVKYGISPNKDSDFKSNVSVFLLVNRGPMGELYVPFDFDGGLKISQRKADYIFPSLYFDVSTSPLYVPVGDDRPGIPTKALERLRTKTKEEKGIQKITNRGLDMRWVDVAIELQPVCEDGGARVRCDKGYPLGILEVLPNESRSGLEDSNAVQIAKAVEELRALTEPFFPASTFDLKAAAGSKGLSVIFRNLFPPKIVTYMHAHIDTLSEFGWAFREDRASDNSTLLGLHRGIVLLQAEDRVKGILVRYFSSNDLCTNCAFSGSMPSSFARLSNFVLSHVPYLGLRKPDKRNSSSLGH